MPITTHKVEQNCGVVGHYTGRCFKFIYYYVRWQSDIQLLYKQ